MDILELFNRLGKNDLNDYIENRQEEDLHLDFKTVNKAGLDRDDRKNFAKALSGFANSDGGLIIWGIVARKNEAGVDCACGRNEIEALSRFMSKLNEFTGSFVSPIVEGVQHKKIETGSDKGFAVSLIPVSDSGPHMAKAGEDRYYKRSGDSFYKMEHFDVEDMFGRRKKPKLSLYTEIISEGWRDTENLEDSIRVEIRIGIENSGRGIARYPLLTLNVVSQYGIDTSQTPQAQRRRGLPLLIEQTGTSQWLSFGGDANKVIYPSSRFYVTSIKFRSSRTPKGKKDEIINYRIMADGVRPTEGQTIIRGEDIRKKIIEGLKKPE